MHDRESVVTTGLPIHKEGLVEERHNEPFPLHSRVVSDMLRRSTNWLEKA